MQIFLEIISDPKIWVVFGGLIGQYLQFKIQVFNKLFKQIKEIKSDLSKIKSSHTYENKLFSELTNTTMEIIEHNKNFIEDDIIKVLNYTRNKIRSFAIEYWDSSYRGLYEKDVRKYLDSEARDVKSQIKELANKTFKGVVKYEDRELDFDSFSYAYTDVDSVIGVFIKTLEANGLDEDKYLYEFTQFLKEINNEQLKSWKQWKLLK